MRGFKSRLAHQHRGKLFACHDFFAPFQYLMLGHNKYIFRPGFRLKARPD
nr:MAG TPA: hypothetical protein [Caudoviricetes sp.]